MRPLGAFSGDGQLQLSVCDAHQSNGGVGAYACVCLSFPFCLSFLSCDLSIVSGCCVCGAFLRFAWGLDLAGLFQIKDF